MIIICPIFEDLLGAFWHAERRASFHLIRGHVAKGGRKVLESEEEV